VRTKLFHKPVPCLFTNKRAASWKKLFLFCSCRWSQWLPSLSVSRRGNLPYGQKGFPCMPGPLMKKCNFERSCSSATCTRACSRFSCSSPVSFVSLLRCYLHPVWLRFNCFYRALFFSLQCQLHWAGFRFILSCRLPSFHLRRHLRRVLLLSCLIPRQS